MKIGIVGGGWAGLAAAVHASTAGHQVCVYEAARTPGGRARAIPITLPDGQVVQVDNGQHILIGAYTETLGLLRQIGAVEATALRREPLSMQFPDGGGLHLPRWPAPWDAVAGIAMARNWPLAARASLLREAVRWRLMGFRCDDELTVAQLCSRLHPYAMQALIDPLCVSALNTPVEQASAPVFLRVLHDAMFSENGSSNLLLPLEDLGTLFPERVRQWLLTRGGELRTGARVENIRRATGGWEVNGEFHEAVLLATPAAEAARMVTRLAADDSSGQSAALLNWTRQVGALEHEAITTVYAWAQAARLAAPMLALRSGPSQPAQFVFDRGQLNGPQGLLAFVISASRGERTELQTAVQAQARTQLSLDIQPLQTVVEKRATFACTPGLRRPPTTITHGLLACGDYVQGPYPATLEGAVRSGIFAARALTCPK